MTKKSQKFNFSSLLEKQYRENLVDPEIDFYPKPVEKKSNRLSGWSKVMLILLLICGASISGYLILENSVKNQIGKVLGTVDTKTTDIISGDNFTLIINQKRPKEFALTNINDKIDLINNKSGLVSSYLYTQNNLQSGFKIMSVQYDLKMDLNSFAQQVKQKLGSEFEITSRDIKLPNGIKLAKIENTKNPTSQNEFYYVTVTSSYYYVIEVYDQIREEKIDSFTSNLIQGLYLNN